MGAKLLAWVMARPWMTWVAHAFFAALVTLAFSMVLDPWPSALLALWGYTWREMDQVFRKLLKGGAVPWLDASMDVLSAALAAALVARWLT